MTFSNEDSKINVLTESTPHPDCGIITKYSFSIEEMSQNLPLFFQAVRNLDILKPEEIQITDEEE